MKLFISEELVKRVECAAKNGSKVAQIISSEIKRGRNNTALIFPENSNANYFESKRIVGSCDKFKSLKIQISCCTKDLNNEHFPDKGNPNSPYFKENRTALNPMSFAGCFVAVQEAIDKREITPKDTQYFESAICVASKVTLKISDKMQDIERAYNGDNYITTSDNSISTLHNSCMRHDNTTRNAADFYANFCGAKILFATDEEGNILGRAIVWSNLLFPHFETQQVSFVDRMYFAFDFVRVMMVQFAKDSGINLMKKENTYSSPRDFIVLNAIKSLTDSYEFKEGTSFGSAACLKVPHVKWHKKGAPYCDTLYTLYKAGDNLYLTNDSPLSWMVGNKNLPFSAPEYHGDKIASMRDTNGFASKQAKICPVCGNVHLYSDPSSVCDECRSKVIVRSVLGDVFIGKTKKYKGNLYPEACFENGKPSKHLKLWEMVQRLY